VIFVFACTRGTTVAQNTRTQMVWLKPLDFFQVAKGFGASPLRLLLRNIVPRL
jgi:ABC-type dipeptide/oligopeptide/nickel transport system permease subunit